MGSRWTFLIAAVLHGILIGSLLGLATSPVAGFIVPALLGWGSFRLIEVSIRSNDRAQVAKHVPQVLGVAIVWLSVVLAVLFLAIGVRAGRILGEPSISSMLARHNVSDVEEATAEVARLTIARRLDQLDLAMTERRRAARALDSLPYVQLTALGKDMGFASSPVGEDPTRRFQMYSLEP
jgi:hypothetical protein